MEQAYENNSYLNKVDLSGHTWKSVRWLGRKSVKDEKRCQRCREEEGKIIAVSQKNNYRVASHPYCRCYLQLMTVIEAGYATKDGFDGADYWLYYKRKLPDNYITKKEANKAGWRSDKKNLSEVCPGKLIGNAVYYNNEGKLPHKSGRIWYEADFDYFDETRGANRILYSNDGLIFVSYDHAQTFYELTK